MAELTDLSYLLDTGSDEQTPPRNTDFSARCESHIDFDAANPAQDDTAKPGAQTSIRVFETIRLDSNRTRLTLSLQATPGSSFKFGDYAGGFEYFVVDGDLRWTDNLQEHNATSGAYIRVPAGTRHTFTTMSGCLLLVKLGQMSGTDRELRNLCTLDESLWLPGPVEGTEVFPLHVHDTKNVLMIRWSKPAYFKPQLDPLGEELFVVSGSLHDAYGSYAKGSWIRNPVPAWQAWGGDAGTIVYYKNGHFPG